ncbi:hypothetical protein [Sphingomonas sp.]|uniref:hypothetical protein n=1 Tax=Sphingomonas sp. TaxID=28214 RepID=UPI003B3A4918
MRNSAQPDFARFSTQDRGGRKFHFTASTDIIDYFEPARAFGRSDLASEDGAGRFQPRVVAVPDRRAGATAPMLFTLGSAQSLHLVRTTADASAGWERIDLHSAFRNDLRPEPKVAAFHVDWSDDDRMTLIVAIRETADTKACRIMVADGLSSCDTDWNAIGWTDWGVRDVAVQGIKLSRRAEGSWLAVLCGAEGPRGKAYLLQSGQDTKSFAAGIEFDTGITLREILAFEVGPMSDGLEAIHCLGVDGQGARGLQSRSIPQFDSRGRARTSPPVQVWRCPAAANVLAIGRPGPDGADLYIAGDGVHCIAAESFDYGARATRREVISPLLVKGTSRLVVAETPEGNAEIWTIDALGQLWSARREGTDGNWSAPLLLREDIAEVAPVPGGDHVAATLLLVYRGGSAAHLWRDAQAQGSWHEAEINLADPEGGAKTTCLGTNFRVLSHNRTPLAGRRVTLTASVPCNLVVNGRSVFVGPGLATIVETREDGSIGIFNRAKSFGPATYRLAVDGLEQAIDLSPGTVILKRLGAINADTLRAATVNDNEALLPEDLRSGADRDKVEGLARALREAAQLAPAGNSGVPGISFVDPDAAFNNQIDPDALPDNYALSVKAGADGLEVTTQAAPPRAQGGGWIEGVGDTLADLLESGLGALQRGASYIIAKVEDGYHFLCEIAGKVKAFVLSTIEEIGNFFEKLWESAKVAAEKAWDYLKFLFEWEDMLLVRDIISNAVEHHLIQGRRQVNRGKRAVSAAMEGLRDSIQTAAHQLGLSNYQKLPSARALDAANKVASDAPPDHEAEAAQNNSITAWLRDQFNAIFDIIIRIEPPQVPADVAEPDLPAGTVLTTIEAGWNAMKGDIQELVGPDFELGDLSFDLLQRIVVTIGLRFAETAVGTLEVIAIKLLELIDKVLEALHTILFSTVRFPFIEKMFDFFGLSIDTSFRLMDMFALIVAVPTTLVYKVVTGERPPAAMRHWKFDDTNMAVAQDQSKDPATFAEVWRDVAGIAGPLANMAYCAYCVYSENKFAKIDNIDVIPGGSYGRLNIGKDAGSTGLLFLTNVVFEIPYFSKPETDEVETLQYLLMLSGLLQVAVKGVSMAKRHAEFQYAMATGGLRRSSEQVYKDHIAGAAFDLFFGLLNLILKILVFIKSSVSGWTGWTKFGSGVMKSLGQILIYFGTWRKHPYVIIAGGVAAAISCTLAIVNARLVSSAASKKDEGKEQKTGDLSLRPT